ncbi:hypothetical protein NM688_g4853 [Phlebia brevispora]|uniref:Uncharacterized protein n=1 Tax=Phlebia brevispora TaxID=194682 RepID=A0ACC1T1X9_9APHY|nr:hypothetical protein NM688_g4853 [Phlebia brevispora]
MRNSTSQHVEHIRERVANGDGQAVRRPLNVRQLLQLLRGNHERFRTSKGKKRAAEDLIENSRRKKLKRGRTEDAPLQDTQVSVPTLQHTFEISYTTERAADEGSGIADEQVDMEVDWSQDEDDLRQWLQEHSQNSHTVFDLGPVELHHRDASMLVSVPDTDSHLMTVPRVDDASFSAQEALISCSVLRQTGRAELSAALSVVTVENTNTETLPFKILLRVQISLIVPAIFTHMRSVDETLRRALQFIFPEQGWRGPTKDADVPFLYSILNPAPSVPPGHDALVQPRALRATLLPFQRRSVAWLLAREGKTLIADGTIVEKTSNEEAELPLFWERVRAPADVDAEPEAEKDWYVNRLTGQLANVRPVDAYPARGGILAEEPGLGKTLECIALILLNPGIGRTPSTQRWDPETRIHVKEVKTTLIVTPQQLAQQWIDELATHAPSLRVLVYEGWTKVKVPISEADLVAALQRKSNAIARKHKKNAKGKRTRSPTDDEDYGMTIAEQEQEEERMTDWCTHVQTYDVCITTYTTLAHDLGVARPPPVRPRRTGTTYVDLPRARSPLVMCEWHRVIMDEVQMVGGGKTAEMVSLIPRVSSFAVSGTPARAQVSDLIHVFKFLRVQPLTNDSRLWNRLLRPEHIRHFVSLFDRYAIRTMKAAVKDELTIPKQTRYLVPIKLGKVEQHVYDQAFEAALLELGLDARGVAVTENWQIDTALLRTWLRKLRGICTHPQVGQLQNMADKNKAGGLKTIGEVLEGMKDQNWRSLMDDRKLKVQALTVVAQLQQHEEQQINRYQLALDNLLQAEKDMTKLIAEIQTVLDQHEEAGRILREQNAAESQEQANGAPTDEPKGKTKQKASRPSSADSEDGDDDGLPHDAAGEEHRNKKRALQQRLRECQVVMHKVQFLKGDVYHVLGERYMDDENKAYTSAEELRRVLLKSTENAARRAMAQLMQEADKGVAEEELYIKVPYCSPAGGKSRVLVEEAHEMIENILNPQSALLWKWRTHLISLLTQPLTSNDEDADGQERMPHYSLTGAKR